MLAFPPRRPPRGECKQAMLAIEDWPLPYAARLDRRDSAAIDLVVIHCTELPDMAMARAFGERIQHEASATGNSGHYYVDRDGRAFRFVDDARVAHHTHGYNPRSIGIELVNCGRYPHWSDSRHQAFTEAYTEDQMMALGALLDRLRREHAGLRWIAGHEDLDRRLEPAIDDPAILLPRRRDPGPMFPWARVLGRCSLERLQPAGA